MISFDERDNRWYHMWATERSHGTSNSDSQTDAIFQFINLNDIIKEAPFAYLNGSLSTNYPANRVASDLIMRHKCNSCANGLC